VERLESLRTLSFEEHRFLADYLRMGLAPSHPDPDAGRKMSIHPVSGHASNVKGKEPGNRDYFTKWVSAL
jgi:hypothetical protein